jgi:2-iminobutanoate/2-iminopropanoate deaminase
MLFYNFHQYSTEYIIEWTKMGDPNSSQTGNIERGWQVVPTDISSHLPFSAAVEANGFVFVSGQASVDKQGKIISGDFEEEMRRSLSNVQEILGSAGLDLGDVVRVTSYVHDPSHLTQYNKLYSEYFSAPMPARTTITSFLSAAIKFEIDVIAVRRPVVTR